MALHFCRNTSGFGFTTTTTGELHFFSPNVNESHFGPYRLSRLIIHLTALWHFARVSFLQRFVLIVIRRISYFYFGMSKPNVSSRALIGG